MYSFKIERESGEKELDYSYQHLYILAARVDTKHQRAWSDLIRLVWEHDCRAPIPRAGTRGERRGRLDEFTFKQGGGVDT